MVEAEDGTPLHVGVLGNGADVLVLSGGPGCVNYLESAELAPHGFPAWFPEPRGVGRSGGGPHGLAQASIDHETIREAMGVESWIAVGHSFGSDLAVRYAMGCSERVRAVVGLAGHGLHKDRTWSDIYAAARHTRVRAPEVVGHASNFKERSPRDQRRELSKCPVRANVVTCCHERHRHIGVGQLPEQLRLMNPLVEGVSRVDRGGVVAMSCCA